MSVRLFVGNLPYEATEEEIRAHFGGAGNVLNVFMPLDRETGRKRGFAFVEYADNAQAQEAIRLYNSQNFKGRPLAVNEARAKESRPPGSGAPYRPSGGPPRPMSSGPRPTGSGGSHSGGHDFGRSDAGSMEPPGRGDRINRKFGPDAKPFRSRNGDDNVVLLAGTDCGIDPLHIFRIRTHARVHQRSFMREVRVPVIAG